jgi:branched-chain amino acid transport system permease protein
MILLLQQLLDGLETGVAYAALGLALVLVHRSTGLINFAQGEIAMFSTYVAFTLTELRLPVIVAVVLAMLLSLAGGMLLERVLVRRIAASRPLALVVVMLGLFLGFNALAGLIWSYQVRRMPGLFPPGLLRLGKVALSYQTLGALGVLLLVCLLLHLLFSRTRLGLMMRGAASNPESCRLLGIRAGAMLGIGWGLAAALGCLAGALVTPRLFLDPNVMQSVLVFAIAAATVGGLDSAVGAVIAGLAIGVLEDLAGGYLVGSDLRIVVPVILILLVLTVRPQGLFGRRRAVRV